ncbi:MAG: GntR family transcriptional regulator, partial [Acidobacteria bacterium]
MVLRLNPSSGVPLYLQLIEQVKHAIETGAIRAGEQLPSVRKMAEDLVINPNTVARAYRDLEHEGIIELKHGIGIDHQVFGHFTDARELLASPYRTRF